MSELPGPLARILASFDDDALVALANKGLVRRASKDLEKQTPELRSDEGETLVEIGGRTVHMPAAGPVQATCDCPAPGICRHIVAATLFLRSLATAPDSEELPEAAVSDTEAETAADHLWAEVIAFGLDELRAWASVADFRHGIELESQHRRVERQPPSVTFADGSECRFVPGAGLDGAICTTKPSRRAAHVVAAVLACKREAGQTVDLEAAAKAGGRHGPEQRKQARAVADLTADAVDTGILHLSGAFADRCRSLAASNEQIGLPRLARMLQSLAAEVELLGNRHTMASELTVLGILSTMHALCCAIAGASGPLPVWLTGVGRGEYRPAGPLRLAGLAAEHWRTRSGFDGVGVLFFDPEARRWLSWADVRRERHRRRHDDESIYLGSMPWPGGRAVRAASRSWIELAGGRVSDLGRLSSTESCRATLGDPVDPSALDFGDLGFEDFRELAHHARDILPVGLGEYHPLDAVVTLFPDRWGVKHFDEVAQVLRWAIFDRRGRAAQLAMPFEATSEQALLALEGADPELDALFGLVGRIVFEPDLIGEQSFAVRPLTLFGRPENPPSPALWHLDFETPATSRPGQEPNRPWWWSRWLEIGYRRNHGTAVGLGTDRELADSLLGSGQIASLSPAAERTLATIERTLQNLADSGCSSPPASSDLDVEARALERLGCARLADALRAVAGPEPGRALLRATYEFSLHRQIAAREAIA